MPKKHFVMANRDRLTEILLIEVVRGDMSESDAAIELKILCAEVITLLEEKYGSDWRDLRSQITTEVERLKKEMVADWMRDQQRS